MIFKEWEGNFCLKKIGGDNSIFLIPLFDFLGIEKEVLFYRFSRELTASQDLGSIYSRINVLAHTLFKFPLTKEIYKLILKENKSTGTISISLSELKNILNLKDDKYPKYYDFHSKVLNLISKDLELFNCPIWFEKVKGGTGHKSKISGVLIHYRNLYHVKVENNTNRLIKINKNLLIV